MSTGPGTEPDPGLSPAAQGQSARPWAQRPVGIGTPDELASHIEALSLPIDARLQRPARWRGPLEPDPAWRPDHPGRFTDAFDRLASTEGGAFELADIADAARDAEPRVLAALHLQHRLVTATRPADRDTARLAATGVLMRAGFRSTLITAVAPHDHPDAPAIADESAWLTWAIETTLRTLEPVAWFRRRERHLRSALETLGVFGIEQTRLLVAWEYGQRVGRRHRRLLDQLGEPWHRLRPRLDLADGRLLAGLTRLRAEETDTPVPLARVARSAPKVAPAARAEHPPPPVRPVASVVVPAFRAADTIASCLQGLQAQDFDEPFEVIVVASGDDSTPAIVRRAFPRVKVIEIKGRASPGAGRNRGIEHATGEEAVAFLAADCVPDPSWLGRRVAAHREGHTLVGGFIEPHRPTTRAGWGQYFAKYWGMLALDGSRHVGRGPLFHLSYARWVVDEFGPFPEGPIAGEDTAYNHALIEAGHRVLFDSAIRARHVNSRRWDEVRAGLREQGLATGALCHDHPIGAYYNHAARRRPSAPVALAMRAIATVMRHRPDLVRPLLGSLPWFLGGVAARRAGFRAGYHGRASPPPVDDGEARLHTAGISRCRPAVSVVVAAFNEEAVIGECLDSLLEQDLDALEIIVVDDGSTDRTATVAASRAVPVVCLPHGGPARGRNAGARVARGDVVVFVDADLILATDCVRRLTEPILAGAEVGTFTSEIEVANPADAWAACWSVHRGVDPGAYMPPGAPDRWANFRAVDRRAFLDAGGYDDVGYGEDMTLAPKLGALAARVPAARMWHHNPDSIAEVWRNARWVGRGVTLGRRDWRRFTLGRSLVRGVSGAVRHHRPRYLPFRLVYDAAVLVGRAERHLRRGRHWK